jgi:hypothetical protein
MNVLTKSGARTLLEQAFASLLDPSEPVENLSRFYAETCVQDIDGEAIDYPAFLTHARAIKRSIRTARVNFDELLIEGSKVAAIYSVESESPNGERRKLKVIAFVTFEGTRIASLTELTRPIDGNDSTGRRPARIAADPQ